MLKKIMFLVCSSVIFIAYTGMAAEVSMPESPVTPAVPKALAAVAKLKPKDFPRKPLELVVAYPPGGGMDVTERVLGKHLEKYVGGKCIIVNKPGGFAVVGHAWLASNAPKDGYTIAIISSKILSDTVFHSGNKWSYKDLTGLGFINFSPVYWVVNSKSKFAGKSAKEIIEIAKANPGSVKLAVNKESPFEYLALKIQVVTGAAFNIIPFQGGTPGMVALLGDHVDMASGYLTEFKSHLDAGNFKMVAVSDMQEDPLAPGIPTFNSILGRDDIYFGAWRYAAVPKGVPADRIKFLEAAIDAALRDPGLAKDFEATGAIVGPQFLSGAATDARLDKIFASDSALYKTLKLAP